MIAPYKCVVVANGSFPTTELPLGLLQKASVIIACDGASETLINQGYIPTAIVGDLDSIPKKVKERYADRIHQVIDQEINDLTKSVRFAHAMGCREVLILGATGLREDHTLGNISLLMDYAPMFDRIEMMSDYGWFTPLLHSATLKSYPGQQISLISMTPDGEITTKGLRWPIYRRHLTAWWQGTLNEAIDSEFSITISENARLLVYRKFCN